MHFRHSSAAAACALLACSFACAQTTPLDPMVVTATRIETPLFDSLPSVSVVTRKQIEQTQPDSLADLLQAQLGIEFGRNGGPGTTTSFFLRGANSTNVVIMVDGVRSAVDGWGNLTAVDIDPAQIERIEVLRGNASALYGEAAIGGVIHITTRGVASPLGSYGSVGVGTRGANSLAVGYNGLNEALSYHFDLGSRASSRLSSMDTSVKTWANPDADKSTSRHLGLSMQYAVSRSTNLRAYVRTNTSDVAYDDSQAPSSWSSGTTPSDTHKLDRATTTVGVSAHTQVTPEWKTAVHIDQADLKQKDWTNDRLSASNADIKSQQDDLRWDNTYALNSSIFNIGIEATRLNFNNTGAVSKRNADGVYGALTHYIDALTLQASVRHDRVSSHQGTGNIYKWNKNTGMVGLGYNLSDNWRLTSSLSTGFRVPSLGELGSNTQLQPEAHRSLEAGVVHHTDQNEWRVVVFSTRSSNAIEWVGFTPENIGRVINQGIELSGQSIVGSTHWRYNVTSQNPRNGANKPLARRASLYATLGVAQRWGSTNVGATLHTSSKRGDSDYNATTLAGYTTLDLTAEHHLNKSWLVQTKVENVFDERYQLASGYNTPRAGVFVMLKYAQK